MTPPSPSPLPGPDRIENSSSYLSNTGQPIGGLGVKLRYVGGKTPTGTTLRNVPHCGRLNTAGESRSKRPPAPLPASTTLKFGMSSGPGAAKPQTEICDGSGLRSTVNVQKKNISKISSKINFFKNLENNRNSDKHHKLSLGPDGLARGLDQSDERRRDNC